MNNKTNAYPRLVGGTFITIVKQHMKNADSMGYICTQSNFVIQFFKAIGVDVSSYKKQLSAPQISHFSRCEAWPFKGTFLKRTNIDSLEASMSSIFPNIASFFKNYMDVDADMKVAAALKEMIETDESIKKTDKFLLDENGAFLTKEAITSASSLPYIPFIVGVALYSLKQDNKEGEATIREWCHHVDKVQPQTSIGRKYWGKIKNDKVEDKATIENKENLDKIYTPEILDSDYEALKRQAEEWPELCDLLDEVNSNKFLFVETGIYRETLKKVIDLGYVMLMGNPGTGKSITSEMVALKMAGTGEYRVHFRRGCKDGIDELFSLISKGDNRKKKDFILIDDCMGQASYELGSVEENELKKLVSYCSINTNKKLLLNSRIRIIQETNNGQHSVCKTMFERMNATGRIIDTTEELTNVEKAHLLRNHIFARLDQNYYWDLFGDKCLAIVNHRSFNPRVIDHVTNPNNVVRIKKRGDFRNEILKALDNPESVWSEIYFNKNLTPLEAKILLKSIFTFSNAFCDYNDCQEVFFRFLSLPKLDESPSEAWHIAVETQNESTIKQERHKNYTSISFIDPSFNDFLEQTVYKTKEDRETLREGVLFSSQVGKVFGWNHDFLIRDLMTLDGRIEKLKYDTDKRRREDIFIHTASTLCCRETLKPIISMVLEYFGTSDDNPYQYASGKGEVYARSTMLMAFIESKRMREFYLGGKISRRIYNIGIYRINLKDALSLLVLYYQNRDCFDFDFDGDDLEDLIKESTYNSITNSGDFLCEIRPLDVDYSVDDCNAELNQVLYDSCLDTIEDKKDKLSEEVYKMFLESLDSNYPTDFTYEINEYFKEDDGEFPIIPLGRWNWEDLPQNKEANKGVVELFSVPFEKRV